MNTSIGKCAVLVTTIFLAFLQKNLRALISPSGGRATARLRQKYTGGKTLAAASNQEFAGLGRYLQNEQGF